MTPSNYQIPVWQATSIPSCRPLISSHCMRPHSQKLYKTEADSQLDYQHSRLHKSWCKFKCIFPFEINHIVNAPTDRELKNSFSQYSTSTLQECIRQTYCMYIYIYIDAVEKPDLDRHQHCFSLTRLFCTYASQNEQITLNYTFQNFSMKVARFPAGDASPSTFMCGSPKQILHSWRNGSQAPSLRPHVLNIEITLPKRTNSSALKISHPKRMSVSGRLKTTLWSKALPSFSHVLRECLAPLVTCVTNGLGVTGVRWMKQPTGEQKKAKPYPKNSEHNEFYCKKSQFKWMVSKCPVQPKQQGSFRRVPLQETALQNHFTFLWVKWFKFGINNLIVNKHIHAREKCTIVHPQVPGLTFMKAWIEVL